MFLEEVTVIAGHKVLVKVDDNILLIAGDPQETLGKYLRLKALIEHNYKGYYYIN